MKTLASLTLALSLAFGGLAACVDMEDADVDVGTTASELGLQPGGSNGNHFYWAAYDEKPYIYKGCPDPGPEPWAERATLHVPRGMNVIELELGTEVALNIRALEVPPDPGFWFRPNTRGATIGIPTGARYLPFSFLVNNERCNYTLDAEIVVE
jgi:hypothetical protein